MRGVVLFLTCYFILLPSAAQTDQIELNGQLLASDSKEPIPWAAVINASNTRYGTTTDESGFFTLVIPKTASNDSIYFSSLGFHAKTIRVKELKRNELVIHLEEKPFELPTIEVTPGEWVSAQVGDKSLPFVAKNNGMSTQTPGEALGAFMLPPKKGKYYLDSLSIYIGSRNFDSPFTLRLFSPKENLKQPQLRIVGLENYSELLPKKVLITPEKPGWITIDLTEFDVVFFKNGLYAILYQIYKDDSYYWQMERNSSSVSSSISDTLNLNKRYGHLIGIQNNSKKRIFEARLSTGGLSYIGNKGYKYFQPAMVFYYSYQK